MGSKALKAAAKRANLKAIDDAILFSAWHGATITIPLAAIREYEVLARRATDSGYTISKNKTKIKIVGKLKPRLPDEMTIEEIADELMNDEGCDDETPK